MTSPRMSPLLSPRMSAAMSPRGGDAGGGVSRPPLPSTAVEYWHSELGCSPTAWVGQLKGTSLPGTGTPTVAPDGTNFNGRVVAQSSRTPSVTGWYGPVSNIAATGTRPWLFVVGKFRGLSSSTYATLMQYMAGGGWGTILTEPALKFHATTHDGTSGIELDDGPANTLPHVFETWLDGTNLNLQVDDKVFQLATTRGIAGAIYKLAIGTDATNGITYGANADIAFALICSTKPTDAEIAALDAWARSYWGVGDAPPLPSTAVELWHSEYDCSPTQWRGQIKGTVLPGANSPTVAPDPGYFKDRPVAQTSVAGARAWYGAMAGIALSGTRPWVYAVARFRVVSASPFPIVQMSPAAGASYLNALISNSSVFGFSWYDGAAGDGPNDGPANTSPHILSSWWDGAFANILVDNALGKTASTASLWAEMTRIGFGVATNGAYPSDTSLALALICSAKPTDIEISQLDWWASQYYSLPTPQRPPLPSSAVEYWHSELGVTAISNEVSQWAGQLKGSVVAPSAPTARPAYGVDGANFNGRSVVQCARTPIRYLFGGPFAPQLTAAGTKPYLYVVLRYRNEGAFQVSTVCPVDSLPTVTTVSGMLFTHGATGNLSGLWYPPTEQVVSTALPGTAPMRAEVFIDTQATLRKNGSIVASAPSPTTAGAIAAISMGGDRGANGGDVSIAFAIICSSKPTEAEIAKLNAWTQAYWGVP